MKSKVTLTWDNSLELSNKKTSQGLYVYFTDVGTGFFTLKLHEEGLYSPSMDLDMAQARALRDFITDAINQELK